MLRWQRWISCGFLLALLLAPSIAATDGAAPALASARSQTPVASTSVQVAGPSPFPDGCEGAQLRSRIYRHSVVEPMLVVDPADAERLVAIWQQDRIATSSSSGVLTAVSDDGGQTWTSSMSAFTRCTGGNATNGGDYPRGTDPWLTISPDGEVYALALTVNAFAGPETTTAMLVSTSRDGGLTWGDPATVTREPISAGFNDKGTITADPVDARFVYVVWDRDFLATQSASGLVEAPAMFSRTVDGGQTWEPPRVIYEAPGAQTIGHVLVVLPNGDLLDLFGRTMTSATGDPAYDLAVIRSSDRGLTWSAPVSVSDIVVAPLQDPYSTFPIQPNPSFAIIPSIAIDRDTGQLHVVWQDARFSDGDHIDVAYTTSSDGETWSTPIKVNRTTNDVPAFMPTVGVLDDGTVGVSYYDLRNASPAQDAILTDLWFVSCRSDCTDETAWDETHVAGSFDLQRAPYARGLFLGDYQGLVGAGNAFLLLSTVVSPEDASSITHAEFVSVTPP